MSEHSVRARIHIPVGEKLQKFLDTCYKLGMANPWCGSRAAAEYIVEDDRLNRDSFTIFLDLEELKKTFEHGNWCLGQAFVYNDLCFINQVDGGDEWLTIKRFDDEVIKFESISMIPTIKDGEFEFLMERLEKATKEQCRELEY